MSENILLNKKFSCDDVTDISDILILFSPKFGKSRGVGEELNTPIVLKKGEIININLMVSIET